MKTSKSSKTVRPTAFKRPEEFCLQEYRAVFQSNLTCYEKLDAFTSKLKLRLDMDPNRFANLSVCLNEAVSNALIHGNRYNPSKKVFLNIKTYEDFVLCTIEDEGSGFEFPELFAAPGIHPVYNSGERGIYIMKCLADLCTYSNSGRMVSLIFYYY